VNQTTKLDQFESGDKQASLDRPFTLSDRFAWLFIAALFGTIGLWMFWIVGKFLGGPGWVEFAIRMILEELAFATVLFALALIGMGLAPPKWHDSLFSFTAQKLVLAIIVVVSLFVASLVFLFLVLPLLLWFGILK
jgi:hypothetical protein